MGPGAASFATPYPQQQPNGYPGYPMNVAPQLAPRGGSPTVVDQYDRPGYGQPPQRPSMPQVAGFGKPKKATLKPWMLVIGALIVAGLAFAITRAFIGGKPAVPPAPTAPTAPAPK